MSPRYHNQALGRDFIKSQGKTQATLYFLVEKLRHITT